MTMEKKNLGLGNMNGMTDQDHRTCGINDMNCLGGEENPCTRQQECVTLKLWKELDEAIKHVVDSYTLEDLVQWQRAMQDNYVI